MQERSNLPIEENEETLTIREAAKILNVHPYTIYDLLKNKLLIGFRLRKRWRIRKSSLEKFMSKNSNEKGK